MFAAIRVRGSVNVRRDIKDTLKMLRLRRVNHCVLLPEDSSTKGMLVLSKDFITWGEIRGDILNKLLLKRGRKVSISLDKKTSDKERKIEEKDLKEVTEKLEKGAKKAGINPVFRLHPPSKGYKSTKNHFPKGDLGYRAQKINELLERMI